MFPWMVTIAIANAMSWILASDWWITRTLKTEPDAVLRVAFNVLCCSAALIFHIAYQDALTDWAWSSGKWGEPPFNRSVCIHNTRLFEIRADVTPILSPFYYQIKFQSPAKREDFSFWFGPSGTPNLSIAERYNWSPRFRNLDEWAKPTLKITEQVDQLAIEPGFSFYIESRTDIPLIDGIFIWTNEEFAKLGRKEIHSLRVHETCGVQPRRSASRTPSASS